MEEGIGAHPLEIPFLYNSFKRERGTHQYPLTPRFLSLRQIDAVKAPARRTMLHKRATVDKKRLFV
jgi:hypothetical protein